MTGLPRHLFVVVGATGDLARRKLLPSLHRVVGDSPIRILGVATQDWDRERYLGMATESLTASGLAAAEAAAWADEHLDYLAVAPDARLGALADRVGELDRSHRLEGNRVLYLALPPSALPGVVTRLGEAGLASGSGWSRLVVEKPFGSDLESARALNVTIHRHFTEDQVFRIDHYLGKETVQNLMVFRFSNPVFEASWNRDRVERIEITVAETLGVEGRGEYYDRVGVIRDMIQSHLTQLLALIAMESPSTFAADPIRDEKVKVLKSIRGIDRAVFGRYEEGGDMHGYRDTPGVAPDSSTPTYAAVEVLVDNWRWQGVPFLLRTGKAMAERLTEIAVVFRRPPVCLFHSVADDCMDTNDVLRLVLQPHEGFVLEIDVKEPGESTRLHPVPLHFSYSEAFGEIPDAYQTLLRDVAEGDQTLFVRADEVEEAWRLFGPVADDAGDVHPYAAATWGPDEARALIDDGEGWASGD